VLLSTTEQEIKDKVQTEWSSWTAVHTQYSGDGLKPRHECFSFRNSQLAQCVWRIPICAEMYIAPASVPDHNALCV